jgi:predicted acyltransferase
MEPAEHATEARRAESSNVARRLESLDAFRGFIVLAMASMGLGLPTVAQQVDDCSICRWIGAQFAHSAWTGCTFWDLIQPAFMFSVGISMAYSNGKRRASGDSFENMLEHTLFRSISMVMLGATLSTHGPLRPDIVLTNVLTQIGLGYPFLFLLGNLRARWQVLAAVLILFGDWAAFYLYPAPHHGFDYDVVGVPADWPHLEGAEAHWNMNTNVAAEVDCVLLNLLPRSHPFEYNPRGYTTLNFVPSLATMIFGLLTGGLLRGGRGPKEKFARMVIAGFAFLLVGTALDASGYCPLVKRLWTPSWAIYSTGWVLLALSAFYAVVDLAGFRRWTFPLLVAGTNPLFIYCISESVGWPNDWLALGLESCLGPGVFTLYGSIDPNYAIVAQMAMVLLVEWLACLALYGWKVFVRL